MTQLNVGGAAYVIDALVNVTVPPRVSMGKLPLALPTEAPNRSLFTTTKLIEAMEQSIASVTSTPASWGPDPTSRWP
jgi:hypothetical protein